MKWLFKAVMNSPPTLTLLLDLTHTTCFLALFPDIFPGYASTWDARRCKAERPVDWRTSAVAVEFHAYSKARYWSVLEPALAKLRQRYADANGTLLTAAMLREPVHHIVSSYHMWPPNTRESGRKQVVPLPAWVALPSTAGLQAGALTTTSLVHRRRGFHNPKGCSGQV